MTVRINDNAIKVLRVLLRGKGGTWGLSLAIATGINLNSVYGILRRLERSGCVTTRWEPGNPADLGRPKRRLYSLTLMGREATLTALQEIER